MHDSSQDSVPVVAKLDHASSHDFKQCTATLLACLSCRLPGFNAQMLSNVIWACATMGFTDDGMFIEAAAQAAIQMGQHLREQVRPNIWHTGCFKCPAVIPECHLTTSLIA